MVSAVSGTTIAGELLETALMLCAGAAGAETAMPPPIKATAGSAAQTLRQGTVIVSSPLLFDMRLPRTNLGSDLARQLTRTLQVLVPRSAL